LKIMQAWPLERKIQVTQTSQPMGFWLEQDILWSPQMTGVPYMP